MVPWCVFCCCCLRVLCAANAFVFADVALLCFSCLRFPAVVSSSSLLPWRVICCCCLELLFLFGSLAVVCVVADVALVYVLLLLPWCACCCCYLRLLFAVVPLVCFCRFCVGVVLLLLLSWCVFCCCCFAAVNHKK